MADDKVEVKITGDATQLKDELKKAQAEVKSFQKAVETLQAQVAKSGSVSKVGFTEQLGISQEQLADARVRVEGLRAQLAELGQSASGAAKGHAELNLATAGSIREFIVLGHEVMQGNFSRIPGSIVVLTERMGGLTAATLASVAPWAAMAAGILGAVYAASRLNVEFDRIEHLKLGADFAGNIDLTRESIKSLEKDLRDTGTLTKADIQDFLAWSTRLHGLTEASGKGLDAVFESLSRVDGPKKALNDLERLLGDQVLSWQELKKILPDISQEQINSIQNAERAGNSNEILAAAMKAVGAATAQTAQSIKDAVVAERDKRAAVIASMGEGALYIQQTDVEKNAIISATAAQEKHTKAIQDGAKAAAAAPAGPNLRDSQSVVENMRVAISQMEDNWKGSRSELLKQESEMWRSIIDVDRVTSRERAQIQIDANHLEALSFREAYVEQEQATARAADELRKKRQIEKDNFETTKQDITDYGVWLRQFESEHSAMARDTARTDVEINKLAMEEKRENLREEVAAGKISRQESYLQEKQLIQEMAQLDIDLLQREIASGDLRVTEETAAANQIRAIRAKLATDIAKLDREIQVADTRVTVEELRSWRNVSKEITSGETQLVDDILSKRNTLAGGILRISGQIIEKEIANDLKYATMRLFYSDLELTKMRSNELGGLIFHQRTEAEKTAASSSGAITRLADWVSAELGITSAKETSAAADIATTAATASTTSAMIYTAALAQIMADASVAAAGAYAATAMIPYIGPELAPAAAVSAYGATLSWVGTLGLPGLDKGAWSLPGDMVAQLHKGETVLPKPFAEDYRTNGGGGGRGTTIIIQALDSADVKQFVKNNAGVLANAVSDHQNRNLSSRGKW